MPNEKMIAALPLAALAYALCHLPPARAAGQDQGMVVSRDAETGLLRQPTAAEMQALHARRATKLKAAAKPVVIVDADGKRHITLGRERRVYDVVTRGADGTLASHCVQGEDAAAAAVRQTVPAGEKEHGHDLR